MSAEKLKLTLFVMLVTSAIIGSGLIWGMANSIETGLPSSIVPITPEETPREATARQKMHYYLNDGPEVRNEIYIGGSDSLVEVRYSLGASCIVTGVSYLYNASIGGDITASIRGSQGRVDWDETVMATSGMWKNKSIAVGGNYLIDDNPHAYFDSLEFSVNHIAILGDSDGGNVHSFVSHNGGGSWSPLDNELIAEIAYETIPTLPKETWGYGSIVISDNVDAHYVTLTGGLTYEFYLYQTSGTGNIDMRLVPFTNHGTTGTSLNATGGGTFPKAIQYTPAITTTYLLLVEPVTLSDVADYAVGFTNITNPPVTDDGYEENDNFANAYALTAGSYSSLVCADDDWYRVSVTAGNNLWVAISFYNIDGDLNLQLYNSLDQLISTSASTSTDLEQVSVDVTTSDYYYLRIYKASNTNNYAMTIAITTIVNPPSDNPPSGVAGFDVLMLIGASSLVIIFLLKKKERFSQ